MAAMACMDAFMSSKKVIGTQIYMAWTRPRQVKKSDRNTNIRRHLRVHAKFKTSLEHKYTMAWTRPCQVKKVIGTQIYTAWTRPRQVKKSLEH